MIESLGLVLRNVWHGQPGGVRAEVAVALLAGALAGILAVRTYGSAGRDR